MDGFLDPLKSISSQTWRKNIPLKNSDFFYSWCLNINTRVRFYIIQKNDPHKSDFKLEKGNEIIEKFCKSYVTKKKRVKIMKNLSKTFKRNKEKNQYRSVFELNVCKKIIELFRYFGFLFGLFDATIRYGCIMKND